MFTISWINIKSGLIYGLLWAILAVFVRILAVGDVFKLNWMELLNIFIMGGLGVFISLLKNLLTTTDGKFVDLVKVIPPTK